MTGWPAFLAELARLTLTDPRAAVRRLVSIDVPMEARWLGLFLVAVLGVLATRLSLLALPPAGQPGLLAVMTDPVVGVPAQILSLSLVSAAIAGFGRVFGGAGRFADVLLVVVWIQFLMSVAQVIELAAILVVPPVGTLLALAALALFLWIVVHAIAELHGFENVFKVFVGMVAGFLLIVTALAVVFRALGFVPVA